MIPVGLVLSAIIAIIVFAGLLIRGFAIGRQSVGSYFVTRAEHPISFWGMSLLYVAIIFYCASFLSEILA